MKHIKTLVKGNLNKKYGGCGECATGCQSACKTSNPMIYQRCEAKARGQRINRD
ncbi:MAG: six-cysteine ranthipeptide SCIFF [Christensenellaceae bacterium]|nr:six-cysteine ranthipeptide SCIFF [Christensenellaceae bacterium]